MPASILSYESKRPNWHPGQSNKQIAQKLNKETTPNLPATAEGVSVIYERDKRRKNMKTKLVSNLDVFMFHCSVCDLTWRVKCPDAQYERAYSCPRCKRLKAQMVNRQYRAKVLTTANDGIWGDLRVISCDPETGLAECECVAHGHKQTRKFSSIHTQIKCLECDRARKQQEYQARTK